MRRRAWLLGLIPLGVALLLPLALKVPLIAHPLGCDELTRDLACTWNPQKSGGELRLFVEQDETPVVLQGPKIVSNTSSLVEGGVMVSVRPFTSRLPLWVLSWRHRRLAWGSLTLRAPAGPPRLQQAYQLWSIEKEDHEAEAQEKLRACKKTTCAFQSVVKRVNDGSLTFPPS